MRYLDRFLVAAFLAASLAVAGCDSGTAGEFHEYTAADVNLPATGPATVAVPDVSVRPAPVADVVTPEANPPSATADGGAPDPAGIGPAGDSEPREVKLLVPERRFRTEGPEGAWRVSYDDFDLLKVLNMEPVTPDAPGLMPDWLKGLDGRRIRVRGFMHPRSVFLETGNRQFVLARDNEICCFGREPKVYDILDVAMRDGETTRYIANRPFDVVGRFHIRQEIEKGDLLYWIDDAVVIEK